MPKVTTQKTVHILNADLAQATKRANRLQQSLNAQAESCMIVSADGRIDEILSAELAEAAQNSPPAHTLQDIFHSEEASAILATIEQAAESHAAVDRFISRDQGRVRVHARPLDEGSDEPLFILSLHGSAMGAQADVLDAATNIEDMYRIIVELAQEGIWVIDKDHRTTMVNQKMTEMAGFTEAEMLGRPIFDFMSDEQAAIALAGINNGALQTKDAHEFLFRKKDGSDLWVRLSKSPIEDTAGNYAGAMAMVVDISEHKRANAAQAQFAAVVQSSGDAIISLTGDGIITTWNAGAEQIYGYSASEMIGTAISRIIPREQLASDKMALERVCSGATIIDHETVRVKQDGKPIYVSATISPMKDAAGRIIGISKISHDITSRKKAEIELLESKKSIEKYNRELALISGIGRELAATFDIRRIYWVIYETFAINFLNAAHLTIALYDEKTQVISCGFAIVDGEELDCDAFPSMPLGQGPTSDAIRSRKASIVELDTVRTKLDSKGRHTHIGDEREPVVGLFVPMLSGSRVIGVINIQSYQRDRFDALDLSLVEIVASQCATALTNTRLYRNAKEEQERFRATFEQAAVGIAHVALDGSFIRVNQRLCEIIGYSNEEMLSSNFQSITHPDDVEEDIVLRQEVLDGKIDNFVLVKRYLNVHSEWIWVNLTVSLVRRSDGTPHYFISVAEDINHLKTTELALRQSEDRYRRLAENAQDIIYRFAIRPVPRFEYVSAATIQITGYTPQEYYANPDLGWALVEASTIFELKQTPDEYTMTPPVVIEWARKDGRSIWMEQRSVPVYDEMGKLIAIEGIARDITERRSVEEALRESEERYRTLFQTMNQGIVYQNATGAITAANTAAERILGLTLDQMQGRTSIDPRWQSLKEDGSEFPGTEHPAIIALQTGEQVRDTVMGVYNPVTDTHRWIMVNATPQFHEGETSPYQVYTTFDDVTERRNMIRQLQDRERTLAMSLKAAQAGVWDWDIMQGVIHWDEQLERIHGLAPGTFGGNYEAWRAGLHPEDVDYAVNAVQDALADIKPFDIEFRIVQPDQTIRHVLGQGRVVRDAAGEPVEMIGVNIDITERKQTEQEINRLNAELEQRVIQRTHELNLINKELEAFNYSVSHDLRTPLRALDGFSQAILEDYGERLDEEGRNYLNRIRLASQRMSNLIDDMLKLSRISRREMEQAEVNLSEIIQQTMAELSAQEPERKVEANIQNGVIIEADRNLIQIAIQNLLGNAWKFTSREEIARITFSANRQGDQIIYSVQDNGVGFDMAYVDKLFGAFQRLHSTNEFDGTGIGLATVQRIIHRHGGKIWADSVPGQGATFRFTLPSPQEALYGGEIDPTG